MKRNKWKRGEKEREKWREEGTERQRERDRDTEREREGERERKREYLPCTTSPSLTINCKELCLSIMFPLGREPNILIVTSDIGEGLVDTPSPCFSVYKIIMPTMAAILKSLVSTNNNFLNMYILHLHMYDICFGPKSRTRMKR